MRNTAMTVMSKADAQFSSEGELPSSGWKVYKDSAFSIAYGNILAMAKKGSHGNVVQRCRREPTQSLQLLS